MAKDTEKLIRQLSLISYLMAERRPVTAMEIRRDVEGYSAMNEDAFARRFYADRSELEALGIHLRIERPADGQVEQENYSLPPENFYLAPIEFTDGELAALQTALTLLDGEFAYAEPLRLALQQLSWGRARPDKRPEQTSVALGITATAGGHDLSQRLAKIETAIFRRKTITFNYYTIERDKQGSRTVDPYLLLFQGGQFYLVGYAHDRSAIRVFRLSRMSGKVAYATKAEHDFQRPTDFDPRVYAKRAIWQYGEHKATAKITLSDRISWQVARNFGHVGKITKAGKGESVYTTEYAQSRALVSWVLGLAGNATITEPGELSDEYTERLALLRDRHTGEPQLARKKRASTKAKVAPVKEPDEEREQAAIRPERFARLVTLASILIDAGRRKDTLSAIDLKERLQVTDEELEEDINVLNIVNFGAGSYVLYAERDGDAVDVDPEPYGDSFARPARLLPVEAKALVAAIDLLGDHLPEGSLASARDKVVTALGVDPVEDGLHIASAGPQGDDGGIAKLICSAIADRRVLDFEYYKENEDEFSKRKVEPYALINGREGWYVAAWDLDREALRHFRLDRIKSAQTGDATYEPRPEVDPAEGIEGWPRTGEVPASSTALVWVSPDRARWAREERTVHSELTDGSVIVELSYAGSDWLVKEILKEAGDAAVLEPAEARKAVLRAVTELGGTKARPKKRPGTSRKTTPVAAKARAKKPAAKKPVAKKPAGGSRAAKTA
ncbi:MAG: WYL domain-containing protein [Solirubrobacterales bacterium]|nr:WYL domain-containing protein [Solirubrobacterales bacterium]